MNIKYLGSYEGNVGAEARWQPGEVRDIQDEDFAALLAASPLWEATDEPVGGGLEPAGVEEAEPATQAAESGDNAPAETATPQAAEVPVEASDGGDEEEKASGATTRRGR